MKCQFTTIERIAMHPQEGMPMIYHDQLNIIAQHLKEMKLEDEEKIETYQRYLQEIIPKISVIKSRKKKAKLTRRLLKSQQDWHDWGKAEHKQLQKYKDQGMFSEPQKMPTDANSLPFMWIYVVKYDGTKKARAPCNGSPRIQGTVTL